MSVNKVIIVGKLGSDPELKYTGSGKAVCNISIATNKVFKDQSGSSQTKTSWHRVIVWGKQAENCNKYLVKGSTVYLEGELSYRKYENKQGQEVSVTEINAMNIQFLGKAEKQEASDNQNYSNNAPQDNYQSDNRAPSLSSGGLATQDKTPSFTVSDIPF